MGISLRDLEQEDHWFSVDFWNRRPIVELIRGLDVIDDDKAESLHDPFCGNCLLPVPLLIRAAVARPDDETCTPVI